MLKIRHFDHLIGDSIVKPSQNLAVWLEGKILQSKSGEWLEPSWKLATVFNVSIATVERALKKLRDKGLICRIQGRGTFIGTFLAETPRIKILKKTSAERLAQSILQDIQSGMLVVNSHLPAFKYMRYRFKASYRTVRKACDILEQKKCITCVGKTYRIGQNLDDRIKQVRYENVYLFSKVTDFSERTFEEINSKSFQKLELELSSSGVNLQCNTYEQFETLFKLWLKNDVHLRGLIFVHAENKIINKYLPFIEELVLRNRLRASSVLWEMPAGDTHNLPKAHSIVYGGSMLTTLARGLAHIVQERGFQSVHFFLDENFPIWGKHVLNYTAARIFSEIIFECRPEILKFYVTTIKRFSSVKSWIEKDSSSLDIQFQLNKYQSLALDTFIDHLEFASRTFVPSISIPGKELWVFQSAKQAVKIILKYRERGIELDRQVCILTLEDELRFRGFGISYLGPDWERLGYQMAHAVLGDINVERSRLGFLRTHPKWIHRNTTLSHYLV